MNNTPETDAEASYPDSSLGECVDADFARKLERERDEARELFAKALVRVDLALSETKKAKEELFWSDYQDKREMQRERDEAREKAERYRLEANALMMQRDEAREETAMWKANHDNQVSLKAMLMDRPDLGDRASRIAELIRERDEARRERKMAREDAEFWHKLYKQFSIYEEETK
jgi:hypothetical protein